MDNNKHWYGIFDRFSMMTDDHLQECVANGMTGVDIRQSPNTMRQIELVESLNIPYSLSFRLNPAALKAEYQREEAYKLIKETNPVAVILRGTVYWQRWDEYIGVTQHHLSSYMKKLDGDKITTYFYHFVTMLRKKIQSDGIILDFYTAIPNWYIKQYAKHLAPRIRQITQGYIGIQPLFFDSYVHVSMDWDMFHKNLKLFEPATISIPPLTKPIGFEVGILPVPGYPHMEVGLLDHNIRMYMTPTKKEDPILNDVVSKKTQKPKKGGAE